MKRRILDALIRLVNALDTRWFPERIPEPPVGGKMLMFTWLRTSLGRPVYAVLSQRGQFVMGELEWSNQWNRPRFKAHPEAIFDQQCVAEIYAKMRDFK